MQEKQRRIMLICSILFFAAAMGWMLSFAMGRTDTAQGDALVSGGSGMNPQDEAYHKREYEGAAYEAKWQEESLPLSFSSQGGQGRLVVLLTETPDENALMIDSRYSLHEILLILPGEYGESMKNSTLTGTDEIQEVFLSRQEGFTRLRICLDGIYEPVCSVEQGRIVLTLEKPQVRYDRIVVLDVSENGTDGSAGQSDWSENIGDVWERIRSGLENEGIRVYGIWAEEGMTAEERAAFANELGADMMIAVRPAKAGSPGPDSCKILYNGTYFIPYFGNQQLAVLLEQHLAQTGAADGTARISQEEILLQNAQVPAAVIELDNSGDTLLSDELYRASLAEGIAGAVMEAYTGMQNS